MEYPIKMQSGTFHSIGALAPCGPMPQSVDHFPISSENCDNQYCN